MAKGSSILIVIILALLIYIGINYQHKSKEVNTELINAQKEVLRIDTIVKRYDSIIYQTKIKTNEKIRIIYLLPDSVLLDSIRARLNEFDSIGTPKNLSYNGSI